MSKLTATLFAAFLFVSCSNDGVPDLSLPCEGLGYYDTETHYCYQELRPRCEDENNCASAGSESCTIKSAAQNGHAYEISCEGKHIGYLDNGKPGEKGESGLDGTNGKGCSIDSTKSGVEITCKTVTLPLSHGNVGRDGEDGKDGENGRDGENGIDGTNGENCTIAQNGTTGVAITCDGVTFPLNHGGATGATGAPGAAGTPGAKGKGCTIAENGTIGVKITCDGTTFPLNHGEDGKDGKNGADGENCTIEKTDEGVKITCDDVIFLNHGNDGEDGKKGDTGAAGKGCTIEYAQITCDDVNFFPLNGKDGEPGYVITIGSDDYWYIDGIKTDIKAAGSKGDNGDDCTVKDHPKPDSSAYLVMTCGEKTVYWPKAMCMATAYDPAKEFCDSRDYKIYELCGSEAYDQETQFCSSNAVYPKCVGETYNTATYVCHYDKIKSFFTDDGDGRDGKKYAYVTIGIQTWMAENLNYNADGSRCYGDNTGGDSQNKCGTYGRLYDWATALNVCPDDWHLPSDEDWNVLVAFVHSNNDQVPYISDHSTLAGKYLKAETGWNGTIVNDDKYGFSALPGGFGDGSNFSNLGYGISWWSTSENGSSNAYDRSIYYTTEYLYKNSDPKSRLYSVRCVRNN